MTRKIRNFEMKAVIEKRLPGRCSQEAFLSLKYTRLDMGRHMPLPSGRVRVVSSIVHTTILENYFRLHREKSLGSAITNLQGGRRQPASFRQALKISWLSPIVDLGSRVKEVHANF